MTLEKDPQQEDFLQGRMPGNPYSSNEPGIGPLMRDIKNKICQDCDLVALLEDDSGMEVNGCAGHSPAAWAESQLGVSCEPLVNQVGSQTVCKSETNGPISCLSCW